MRTLIIFLLIVTADIYSQTTSIKVRKDDQPQTFVIRERSAFFKDSTDSDGLFIADFINSNIKLPDSVSTGLIKGIVIVNFTIKENGDLANVRVLKKLKGCSSCDKEAVRLISSMPKWTPGLIRSKTIASDRNLTISFNRKD